MERTGAPLPTAGSLELHQGLTYISHCPMAWGKSNCCFSEWILVKFSSKSYIIYFEYCKILEVRQLKNCGYIKPSTLQHSWCQGWTCHITRPSLHDDVINLKHFPRSWPFVRGIHQSPVNSPHKGQWHGALMFSFICAWINGWVNNREAGDLRCHCAHYDVIVMGNQPVDFPWEGSVM